MQDGKPEEDLQASNADTDHDEEYDDPGDPRHLLVGYRVGEDLAQIEEYTAAFVKNLDARLDLEILAHSGVQWMKRRFRVPEEVWRIEHV
jgi:hypothetical protein